MKATYTVMYATGRRGGCCGIHRDDAADHDDVEEVKPGGCGGCDWCEAETEARWRIRQDERRSSPPPRP